ncbi:sialic acid-binding Ig-like lectin 12 [Phodopus roborovskii]|uniref:Siglece protein n=1 Tax=Phodopus roborovskii TaxID=109678 RepID=A0AAV0ADZ2_PHORO|nr:sialic acid-binding Ig-like lectin 12 [Phodopus roborovskii]CAH7454219.1 Siglece [Phodopus roborovskii]
MLLLLLLLWGVKGVEGGDDALKGYTLSVKTKIVVQEGLCVLIPCKFSYPKEKWTDSDPIHGYWFWDGGKKELDSPVATNNPQRLVLKETQGRFSLLGHPGRNDCSLDIKETRKEDVGSYFFRLERGQAKFNYLRNKMTLHVTAFTETPRIIIPKTLEAGRPSNLTCSAPWACGSPTFSWTGASVSVLSTNTTGSSVLTVIPQPWDHDTNLTCQVTLPGSGVTTRMTIRLNVLYAPRNLTVTVYQGANTECITLQNGSFLQVSEGQSLGLLCSTESNPPATLNWTWNNRNLSSKLSKPGILELFLVDLKHEVIYTCQAQNALGSQHISLRLYPLRSTTSSGMTVGAFVGAGTTTLLFLFCCIVLLAVRYYRRRPARPAVEAPDSNALKGSVSQNALAEPQADSSSEPPPPTAKAAPSSTEEEVHYASISFHEMKPRSPQGSQDITEYSEIKSHK